MRGVSAERLRAARAGQHALIGFSIYNLEQGLAVVRAAEAEEAPVLLQAGSSAFRYCRPEPLMGLALGLADSAAVEVGVHLDHATHLSEIHACLAAGYTSVMFDGSALPLEENVRLTAEVVRCAHDHGAWVEAELAGIAGDEDESSDVSATALTNPSVAAGFVAATGVDALAVAVGNVHGLPAEPVDLDLDLLGLIAEAIEIPLVLHGASGLPDAEVQSAIALGVAKLNVNTELRRAFRVGLLASATAPPAGDGIASLLAAATQATQTAAQEKLSAFTARAAAGGRR
jgi:fructose-bisphosphate aldolase class II/tagatose 1,6-diphosphate aldolase GatY/KbaY